MPSIRTDHLVSAIENCDQRLRVFRDKYRERVKKYVGRNYSNDGWSNPRPDNGIAMQVNILRRFLVSSNPRILAIPTVPSLASEAASLAESVNARAEAIRLGDTLDMGIVTALLFGMSVTKTCYVPGGYGQPGSPSGVHVDCVDPDDLVLDLSARKIDEVGMIGNRYRLPLEYVRNSPIYNQDVARKLSPNEDIDQTPDGTERASSIGAGGYSSRLYGVVELVDLIDIYLPYDNWFLTMADDRSGRVLRSEPWKGPPHGPYRVLKFLTVPSQIMPLSVVAVSEDRDDTKNEIANKNSARAVAAKDVYAAPIASHADTENVLNAADGDIVNVAATQNIAKMSFLGPDQALLMYQQLLRNQFMEAAGSLQVIGGLAPQAETLGQEELLNNSASMLVNMLKGRLQEHVLDVMKDIAAYHYFDRTPRMVTKTVGDMQFAEQFGPGRVGEWSDYATGIRIEPNSLTRRTPEQRFGRISAFVRELMNALPLMAQQGIVFDWNEYLEIAKQYGDMPEIARLLRSSAPLAAEEGRMPTNTTRTYERVNRPGAMRQQQDEALVSMAGGGDRQPSEMASAFRQAG